MFDRVEIHMHILRMHTSLFWFLAIKAGNQWKDAKRQLCNLNLENGFFSSFLDMCKQTQLALIRTNRKEVTVLWITGNEIQILWLNSMYRILDVERSFLTWLRFRCNVGVGILEGSLTEKQLSAAVYEYWWESFGDW